MRAIVYVAAHVVAVTHSALVDLGVVARLTAVLGDGVADSTSHAQRGRSSSTSIPQINTAARRRVRGRCWRTRSRAPTRRRLSYAKRARRSRRRHQTRGLSSVSLRRRCASPHRRRRTQYGHPSVANPNHHGTIITPPESARERVRKLQRHGTAQHLLTAAESPPEVEKPGRVRSPGCRPIPKRSPPLLVCRHRNRDNASAIVIRRLA